MSFNQRAVLLAGAAAPALAKPSRSPSRKLVEQWLADVDRNRWMSPDFRMHFAGMPNLVGIADYIAMASMFYDNLSQVRHRIEHLVGEGDKTGAFDGIAATGRRIAVAPCVVVRIAEEWVLNDSTSLLAQLRS